MEENPKAGGPHPDLKMEPQAQPTARSARRAGPGRARPGALGGRKLGLRAPTQQAAAARSEGRCATGAGAALTVVFVSAARSGRGRTQRRLRGSYHPHARSCAPRRTRRFLALAPRPGSGEGRGRAGRGAGALRGPRWAAPPAPPPARGPALAPPAPALSVGSASAPATRRTLQLRRLGIPGRGGRRAGSRDGGPRGEGRAGRWRRGLGGSAGSPGSPGSPSPPSGAGAARAEGWCLCSERTPGLPRASEAAVSLHARVPSVGGS